MKYVMFDLGRVLVTIRPDEVTRKLAKLSRQPIEAVADFMHGPVHMDLMAGKIDIAKFHQIFDATYFSSTNFQNFCEIWEDMIEGANKGIEKLLESIASEYELIICSNTDALHWKRSLQLCDFIEKRFSRFFLSYEMGLIKPDKQIFQQIIEKLETLPKEIVFIDDTLENVQSARSCGIGAIHADQVEAMQKALEHKFMLHMKH